MTLNCRPGDLAVVVELGRDCHSEPWAIGRIVRCLTTYQHEGHTCWRVDPPLRQFVGVYDGALRPIRDPGEDARDESHAWLPPVPTKEIA